MTTRQELYDRIRESSKDEVILDEMIRLGFWPKEGILPSDPADEVRRQSELQQQLRALTTENSRLQNVDALKKAARKQRMAESQRRKSENKERREKERVERAAAWRRRKQSEILYLGDGVSTTLSHQQSDVTRLQCNGLPVLHRETDLAEAIEVSAGELRFLAFHRRASQTTHYRRFGIPKKTGGIRKISAPMPRLKRAQEWVLNAMLEKIELHRAAHGFRRGRSIVTNAQPHVGSDVVINVDMKDFFPTITQSRIRGVFRSFGYSGQLATILSLLCSEPETDEVKLDGRTFFVARTDRRLPQGAPSSPMLTNIICRGLDGRLQRIAEKLGFVYTRYADDITLSGSGEAVRKVGTVLRQIEFAVESEGFQLHPDKTRILRRSSRQEVTGLVVNERVSVKRDLLRQFRATLFQIERDGPAGKQWGSSSHVMTSIEGFANFVAMVDDGKGRELQQQVARIHERHGRGMAPAAARQKWVKRVAVLPDVADSSATDSPPKRKKPWWKFW